MSCVAVMPLAPLISSGMVSSIHWNLRLIIDNASVPIIGSMPVSAPASDAASIAMELGCDGKLMNTPPSPMPQPGADGERQ